MESKNPKDLVNNASQERLREIILTWSEIHDEFRKYAEHSLNSATNEIDFEQELDKAIRHEAMQIAFSRNSMILNWRNIYYKIDPWFQKAEKLSTANLLNMTVAIITQVLMSIDDDDFTGDDWYGDDYSMEIGDILESLGNLGGLLVVRQDLTDADLKYLEDIVTEAQSKDKISNYINTPYEAILNLIKIRQESNEVTNDLYDYMIDSNFNLEAGKWVCRKVTFLKAKGLTGEANSLIDQNLKYPEVRLHLYDRLLAEKRWKDALELIDKAIILKKQAGYSWHGYNKEPDWLSMKQQLLKEHGSKEEQIANLSQMFHESLGEKKSECYSRLKELVGDDKWKGFYPGLLSKKIVCFNLDLESIAPFLILEKEFDWLYLLLEECEQRDRTDYRTPLKYAPTLMASHNMKIRAMLVRTFRAYATDRFSHKKRVKSGKYHYFCSDLKKLADFGAKEELNELILYFKEEYRTRSALISELRNIQPE